MNGDYVFFDSLNVFNFNYINIFYINTIYWLSLFLLLNSNNKDYLINIDEKTLCESVSSTPLSDIFIYDIYLDFLSYFFTILF